MTIQKNVGDSPRKLRLVADMIRKMNPNQAVEMLHFTNKAAASTLAKAIKTALGNAKGKDVLYFDSIEINEGMKMKRYRVGTAGRGRGRPYKKRLSHIKIVLTDEAVVKDQGARIKNQDKKQRTEKVEEVSEQKGDKS